MNNKAGRKMDHVVTNASFAEAEEMDVAYYASIDWKESVSTAEEMRRAIWDKAYNEGRGVEKTIRKVALTDMQDDVE